MNAWTWSAFSSVAIFWVSTTFTVGTNFYSSGLLSESGWVIVVNEWIIFLFYSSSTGFRFTSVSIGFILTSWSVYWHGICSSWTSCWFINGFREGSILDFELWYAWVMIGTIFFLPVALTTVCCCKTGASGFWSSATIEDNWVKLTYALYVLLFFTYSSSTAEPYFLWIIILFSASLQGAPRRPGWNWRITTSPSVELASKILPLKPQLRSVMPALNKSIMITSGFGSWGFQIVIVDSALARAITLNV